MDFVRSFSLLPTLLDQFNALVGQELNGMSTIGLYGSQRGYCLANFMLLYIIGGYLRRKIENGEGYSHKMEDSVTFCLGNFFDIMEPFQRVDGFLRP